MPESQLLGDDVLTRLQPVETNSDVISRLQPVEGHSVESIDSTEHPKAPANWRDMAQAEVQKQGLNPTQPGHASQMVGIYDAFRKQYGTPEEQAQPDLGIKEVQQRHATQAAANAQRGQLASFAIEALHPAGQVAALGEKILAPVAGLINPGAAGYLMEKARQLQDVRGAQNAGGVAGQIVGNIPTMLNPAVAMGTTAEEVQHEIEQRREEGQQISGTAGALDVAGQAVLSGAMAHLFGANVTGGMAKVIEGQLSKMVPGLVAKLGARGATGALINIGQTVASNAVTKGTVNPEQPLTEGTSQAALLGAGMETGIGAVHDIVGRLRAGRTEAAPTAPPEPIPLKEEPAPTPPPEPIPLAEEPQRMKVAKGQMVPQMPDTEGMTGEEIRQLAEKKGYNTAGMENLGKKPLLARLQEYRAATGATEPKAPEEPIPLEETGRGFTKPPEAPQIPLEPQTPKTGPIPLSDVEDARLARKLPQPPTPAQEGPAKPSPAAALPKPSTPVGKAIRAGQGLLREAGTWMGSDLGLNESGQNVANRLRQMHGEQLKAQEDLESRFTQVTQAAKDIPQDELIQHLDQFEKGGAGAKTDPKLADYFKMRTELNDSNIARMKALGIPTEDMNRFYAGRDFEFPDEGGKFPGERGYTGRGSIAGPENWMKSRSFDRLSDAAKWVEENGGRMKHGDPLKMALGKDIQVSNSLTAHETFQKFLDSGLIHEGKPGQGETAIDDPLRYTHPASDKATVTYAAPEDAAYLVNHLYSEASKSKIVNGIANVNQLAVRTTLALSGMHYLTETMGSMGLVMGQGLRDIFRGNIGRGALTLGESIPGAGRVLTALREGRMTPEQVEARRTALAAGGGLGHQESILKPGDWEKAKTAWNEGDKAKAAAQVATNIIKAPSDHLFKKFIPQMQKRVAAILADSEVSNAQAKGVDLNSDQFVDTMNKHLKAMNDSVGGNNRLTFQNKVAAQVNRLLFGLPEWTLGKARLTADAVKGFGPLLTGKNADPATYAMLGHVAAMTTAGVATYMMLNKGETPKSWNDIRHIPIKGWTDAEGNTIRLTNPSPVNMVMDLASGDRTARDFVTSRMSPVLKFANELTKQTNYRGVQTTWKDAVIDTLKPYNVSAYQQAEQRGVPGAIKAAATFGLPLSAKRYGESPAEQMAHELIVANAPQGGRTPAEAERNDLMGKLSAGLRMSRKGTEDQIQQAVTAGKIEPSDINTIVSRATEKPGLASLLKNPELRVGKLMDVWDKMTPQEKEEHKLTVFERLANAKPSVDFPLASKMAAMQKIQDGAK